MKIQHKRSEQLEGSSAKEPSSEFMEYGELAVNFNGVDPAIFLKDSNNNIVRIAGSNSSGINDGAININAGTGLIATGSNATANQSLNTTRQLSINEEWLNQKIIDVSPDVNNGQININAGTGLTATGNNATANQSLNTTRQLSINEEWLDQKIIDVSPDNAGNGEINFNAGIGLIEIGSNARANQSGNTTKTFNVDIPALNTTYLRIDSDAGDQTVLSSGTTTFVGTISPANYDLDSLPLLP